MDTKITSTAQVEKLRIGDIIKKFPIKGSAEDLLEGSPQEQVEIFEIRTVNKEYKMIGLVMTRDSITLFASPGDIGRQFISMDNMIAENIWWLWNRN